MSGIAFTIILTTFFLVPENTVITDTVDIIELFHHYNRDGEKVADYLIFWNYYEDGSCHVVDWRKYDNQKIEYIWHSKRYEIIWHDYRENMILRQVLSKFFMENHSCYDYEIIDREELPKENRRLLSGSNRNKQKITSFFKGSPD